MAIISATAMIRGISLFHVTLAILLLRNPAVIANQGVILLLGESMHLPTPREFNKPSAASAFLAVLFAFLGLTDLTALALPDDVFGHFWGAQTPVRCAFLFALTGYSYIFKEGGMFAPRGHDYTIGVGASLNNSMVFTWGFFELSAWFWVFVTLREERREAAQKLIEKLKAEEDRL
ncbi:uncharacterized protein K460DRAFT_284032 [Cucurbitaria berberidis CBS 394.84]|uniref:Increased loss of mitochondrial DNA protein 1 n=1 Tax=Cucurbitaria berberidis CBS 394.84 TaxID=1168544 RepID=A0A9P4L8V6_9PLEO|nr:uncharacterized protein K460DRAFT_284032 [Cucurbitaria berberidis CBS 394.84]KAF1845693.1 hypothetical protein K460DRAFT_284032 [Cucurbitaria berberidis CBS 394.84]